MDCSQSLFLRKISRRDRTLCVTGSHLGWVSKLLRGWGAVWEEARTIVPVPEFWRSSKMAACNAKPIATVFSNHLDVVEFCRYFWSLVEPIFVQRDLRGRKVASSCIYIYWKCPGENARISETLNLKIFWGSMSQIPLGWVTFGATIFVPTCMRKVY